jgi:hypothetical protein
MFARRLLVLVAVLMGLTALAASLSPPPEPIRRGASAGATPTPAPPAAPTRAAPGAAGEVVRARISASAAALPRVVRAMRDDLVELVVAGDVVDTVAIDGLPVLEPIDPDSPVRLELYADRPGRFPIRLLDAGRRIGTLRVSG